MKKTFFKSKSITPNYNRSYQKKNTWFDINSKTLHNNNNNKTPENFSNLDEEEREESKSNKSILICINRSYQEKNSQSI